MVCWQAEWKGLRRGGYSQTSVGVRWGSLIDLAGLEEGQELGGGSQWSRRKEVWEKLDGDAGKL